MNESVSRRAFLRKTATKAAYVAPFVAVLGPASEAFANSKDGIAWSRCASFQENCDTRPCCPGFLCLGSNTMGMRMCVPSMSMM